MLLPSKQHILKTRRVRPYTTRGTEVPTHKRRLLARSCRERHSPCPLSSPQRLPSPSPALWHCSESGPFKGSRLDLFSYPQSLVPPVWVKSQPSNPEYWVPCQASQGTQENQQGQSLEPTFHSLAPWPANLGGKNRLRPWLGTAHGGLLANSAAGIGGPGRDHLE